MFLRIKTNGRPGKNTRRHERSDFVQASHYRALDNGGDRAVRECLFDNISLGGFGCLPFDALHHGISRGGRLMVFYRIGITLRRDRVSVRYIRTASGAVRFGCEFVDDDQERTALIRNYIDNGSPMSRGIRGNMASPLAG